MLQNVYYAIPLLFMLHCGVVCWHLKKDIISVEHDVILTPAFLIVMLHILYRNLVSSNPGIPPMDEYDSGCKWCGRIKLKCTKHCRMCNVCVEEFDHHCDLLGICIGKGNRKRFLLFLFACTIMCMYATYTHYRIVRANLMGSPMIILWYEVFLIIEMTFSISFLLFFTIHFWIFVCGTTSYSIILCAEEMFNKWCKRKDRLEKKKI